MVDRYARCSRKQLLRTEISVFNFSFGLSNFRRRTATEKFKLIEVGTGFVSISLKIAGTIIVLKMRRRAGVGAVHKQKLEQEKYKDKGTVIQENQFEQMTKQLEVFRANLEEFASKYKNEIKKNSQFRRQFQEMCAAIGVDPLASGKGFWSVLGIGDFYYELGVQIIEVCMATSYKNGGLIGCDELRDRLLKSRSRNKQNQEITIDDLFCAIRKLKIFGNGFCLIPVDRGQWMIQSVPGELSMDQTEILKLLSSSGEAFITFSSVQKKLNWEKTRVTNAINLMLAEGWCWMDRKHGDEHAFWFPSLFKECILS